MDTTTHMREELPDPSTIVMDAHVWMQESNELRDLAETIVNRHPRFAWLIVDAWISKHEQLLIDKK